jgi:glucose/arabinose dehydrogenase
MRRLVFGAALIFAACSGADSNGQQTAAQSGAPVAQGAPNTDFAPAFTGQTRAPERMSGVRLHVETIASGLAHPWALAFLPDGRLLVTERPGRLRIVTPDGNLSAPLQGLPAVYAENQGGLLDVALAPDFAASRLIYWSYAEARERNRNGTSVARGRLSDDATRVENVQIIFRQQPAWESSLHFGSRLVFDREGRLYVGLGERSVREARPHAQDLSTHLGKVIRINVDGSAPQDNPFVGRANARPEIWAYGVRNIQGADLHPETGELWTIEHGPRGGDEINLVRAGRNYGWPTISYGEEYSGRPIGDGLTARAGMEQPVYYWDPVIAPGGMHFYRGALFPWRGNLLVAGLVSQGLVRLELDGERVTGEERFALGARVRDVAESEDGALWVITDEDNGRLLRLTPQS